MFLPSPCHKVVEKRYPILILVQIVHLEDFGITTNGTTPESRASVSQILRISEINSCEIEDLKRGIKITPMLHGEREDLKITILGQFRVNWPLPPNVCLEYFQILEISQRTASSRWKRGLQHPTSAAGAHTSPQLTIDFWLILHLPHSKAEPKPNNASEQGKSSYLPMHLQERANMPVVYCTASQPIIDNSVQNEEMILATTRGGDSVDLSDPGVGLSTP